MYLDIYKGTSKKTGGSFEALKLKIGDWETLIFPRTKFEMDYIKKQLDGQNGK